MALTPYKYTEEIYTQPKIFKLIKYDVGTSADAGVVLFTCSVTESASASSYVSYSDSACIAAKIAADLVWEKALVLLRLYFKANPLLESNSNSKSASNVGSKCSCPKYNYGSYTFYHCGGCSYCATGDTTCCNNIHREVTKCVNGKPQEKGLPVYCGCCNTGSCSSTKCPYASC